MGTCLERNEKESRDTIYNFFISFKEVLVLVCWCWVVKGCVEEEVENGGRNKRRSKA